LVFVILFTIGIAPVLGQGPNWFKHVALLEACKENWWTNLLYINNYVIPDVKVFSQFCTFLQVKLILQIFISQGKLCIGQAWYLACDMQMHVFSPLVFYPMYK